MFQWYITDWGSDIVEKSVDYGRMAEILVQRAASPDEFTRLTAITWVSRINHASAWRLPVI